MKAKSKKIIGIVVFFIIYIALTVLAIINGHEGEKESIKQVMRDAVLHGDNKVSLFGLMDVNPGFISAITVTGILLFIALLIRIFAIPKFKIIPGKFQIMIEEWVGFFSGLAKTNSPHRNKFLTAYLFGAGSYVFFGTMFELFGLQCVTTNGLSMAMPAPLSDINAAIGMGFLSYFVILGGGLVGNGFSGMGKALKDFSLPISMSFRLFGALLSGLLVTELVYYYVNLSFVLPVIVAVLFTLIHAIIQTYVLTMLTALFYGESSEPGQKKEKKQKIKANA